VAPFAITRRDGSFEILNVAPGEYDLSVLHERATETALDSLACRIPVTGFPSEEFARPAVGNSQTLQLNLEPWLTPGDDLTHLRFTSTLGVPMQGREATEGVLLLAGMRDNNRFHPLRSEDLLPLEMLTARLQAARSQTTMLEKLIDSEKFAGLGQLAGNVTQQLNNPLTVILGYASLLEETSHLDDHERKGIEAILSEARDPCISTTVPRSGATNSARWELRPASISAADPRVRRESNRVFQGGGWQSPNPSP
jgi:signal transduction histidine kinase